MKVNFGIRAHDIRKNTTIEELCDAVDALGIRNLQLVINKALADKSYSEENTAHIKEVVDKHHMHIVMLGGYFNPVHPDHQIVEQGIKNFKALLDIEHEIGAEYVGSETGSYNGSPWIYVPKNQTEEGYQESKGVFNELTRYAEKKGADIALEGAWGHVMYKPSVMKRLYDDLNSPRVHITVDLYNFLYEGNFDKRDEIFHEALSAFKDQVRIIHLKDAKIIDGKLIQLAPGEGDFHYDFMFKEIREYCPNAYCIFEGVGPDKIGKAYDYLRKVSEKI